MAENTAYQDEETLKEYYVNRGETAKEIGERFGVAETTILRWLDKNGIETRDTGRRPSAGVEELRDSEWLEERYSNGASTRDIADEIGCHHSTVEYWLKQHSIDTRPAKIPRGELHWAWKGGADRNYGPAWDRKREGIIRRDNEKCARCGMPREEHKEKHSKDLEVHHINNYGDFDDKEMANKEHNLITLCISCHNRLEGLPIDNR